MLNGNKDYCCDNFKNDVEKGNIVRADTRDGTGWYHKEWQSYVSYCPYCGSNVSGKGSAPRWINASNNPKYVKNIRANSSIGQNKKTWFSANKSVILVLVTVLFVILVLSSLNSTVKPYKVMNSGVTSNDEIFWLDNNRIFFYSNEKLAPFGGPRKGVVWDTSTGKFTIHHQFGEWGRVICVRDTRVFYSILDKNTRDATYYFGPLGEGRGYPPPGEDMRIDPYFNCDWVPKKANGPVNPGEDFPRRYKLRDENYIEELGDRKRDSKEHRRMIYRERDGDRGTEMPFDFVEHNITYNQFLDAYVVNPRNVVYPKTDFYWVIERNGTIKEHRYPQLWTKLQGRVHPLREGYLIYCGEAKRGAGTSLFLVRGGKTERLMEGFINHISISPDGCRIAFTHAKNVMQRTTLKMINICKGGDKNK